MNERNRVSGSDAVTDWIRKLDDPNRRETAARNIVDTYMHSLLAMIRTQLQNRYRAVIDEEDVLRSAWRRFFRTSFELSDRNSLFGLLAEIAIIKTGAAARRHSSAIGDRRRVEQREIQPEDENNAVVNPVPLEAPRRNYRRSMDVDSEISADSFFNRDTCELMAMDASPEQATYVIEFFKQLPDDLQQVFTWVIEGYSNDEIANKLGGCDVQTVLRQIERIRRRLNKCVVE